MSTVLFGQRRMGKTEIFKRIVNRLFFEQDHRDPKTFERCAKYCRGKERVCPCPLIRYNQIFQILRITITLSSHSHQYQKPSGKYQEPKRELIGISFHLSIIREFAIFPFSYYNWPAQSRFQCQNCY
jgi:hypothetical protein